MHDISRIAGHIYIICTFSNNLLKHNVELLVCTIVDLSKVSQSGFNKISGFIELKSAQ